jgi:hypothetical protein
VPQPVLSNARSTRTLEAPAGQLSDADMKAQESGRFAAGVGGK